MLQYFLTWKLSPCKVFFVAQNFKSGRGTHEEIRSGRILGSCAGCGVRAVSEHFMGGHKGIMGFRQYRIQSQYANNNPSVADGSG